MPYRAIRVNGTPEFNKMYTSFLAGSSERILLDEGLEKLKQNIAVGEKIQKRQWPPLYVKRDGIDNLWKLNLSRAARMIYTVVSDGNGYSVLVLEAFLGHKEYDKRFGYR